MSFNWHFNIYATPAATAATATGAQRPSRLSIPRIIPPHSRTVTTPTPSTAFRPWKSRGSASESRVHFAQQEFAQTPQAFPVDVDFDHHAASGSSDAGPTKHRKRPSVRFRESLPDVHVDAKDHRNWESLHELSTAPVGDQVDNTVRLDDEQVVAPLTEESEESEDLSYVHGARRAQGTTKIDVSGGGSDVRTSLIAPRELSEEPTSPPKVPDLIKANGRFTAAAKQWFRNYWIYLLREGVAGGSLPTLKGASRTMRRAAVKAGVHMNSQAFESHRNKHKNEFEEMEIRIAGRPYRRGWHHEPVTVKRPASPDEYDYSTPKRMKRDPGKQESQESIVRPSATSAQLTHNQTQDTLANAPTIVLSDKERKHMKYQMDYAKEGGRLSTVWEYMQRNFPQRGFTQEEWKEAYRQNM